MSRRQSAYATARVRSEALQARSLSCVGKIDPAAYREIVDVPSSAMTTSTESDVSLGPLGSTVMLAVT
jgi:hypothetical protein